MAVPVRRPPTLVEAIFYDWAHVVCDLTRRLGASIEIREQKVEQKAAARLFVKRLVNQKLDHRH